MQPSTEMMSYQKSHVTDEVVPFGTAITPPTAGHRLSTKMIAIVAAGTMLVVAGGTVWMQDISSPYNYSSGSFKTVDGDLTSEYGGAVGDDCWPKGTACIYFWPVFTCQNCCSGGHSIDTGGCT